MGNLAVCNLFIRSGANPASLNSDRQTSADVAFAEGHDFAAELLSSLVARSQQLERVEKPEVSTALEIATVGIETVPEHHVTVSQQVEPAGHPSTSSNGAASIFRHSRRFLQRSGDAH